MACVSFSGVTKRFGRAAPAVDRLDLAVERGEFLALLGPSGCGKTTVLRLLAGFETPEQGEIVLEDRVVAAPGRALPPEKRELGMVFQSYALWPHMSVAENVAFALRVRGLARAEREARVSQALALVGLAGFETRRIHQLSGGQRQRVALARCLAMRPRIVLLDEPLANLDAHLRETMQREFRRIHAETGAAFVYVTHDQSEALSLADRVAVMDAGRLQQLAPPERLYREPATAMVARFVGRGIVVPVAVAGPEGDGMRVTLGDHAFRARGRAPAGATAQACLRAESLRLAPDGEGLSVRVLDSHFHGATSLVTVVPEIAPEIELRVVHAGAPPQPGTRRGLVVDDAWILPEEARA